MGKHSDNQVNIEGKMRVGTEALLLPSAVEETQGEEVQNKWIIGGLHKDTE